MPPVVECRITAARGMSLVNLRRIVNARSLSGLATQHLLASRRRKASPNRARPSVPSSRLRRRLVCADTCALGSALLAHRVIRIGLYCLHAKSNRTSASLDVDVRCGDVGIEPLVSLAHRHPAALELAWIVSDGERRYSTRDGVFSVLAGAYDHQPSQTGERHHARDIRGLCLDTQSHVPRPVGSTSGLGRQAGYTDPACAGAAIHSAHTASTSSPGGARPASAIRPGLCSILPACKPLVGAQRVNRPLSGVAAGGDITSSNGNRTRSPIRVFSRPR
jgi:hypothetical protein